MRLFGKIEKTWGYEDIIITNDNYCTKYLCFSKSGNRTSMHFHREKHETWKVVRGSFIVKMLNTKTAEIIENKLMVGDEWVNEPLEPHQLIAIEDDSLVLETSTADSVEDNYRVWR